MGPYMDYNLTLCRRQSWLQLQHIYILEST